MKLRKKILEGIIVSDKMEKTATVSVESYKSHKVYKKQFKFHKKYKIHDEKNECQIGDIVSIIECRPYSKSKTFKLYKILKKNVESLSDNISQKDTIVEKSESVEN